MINSTKTVKSNESLIHYLNIYCDVNGLGPNWQMELRHALESTKEQEKSRQFKQQLRMSITSRGISLYEYELATGQDFDSIEELEDWLRELWVVLYDSEPLVIEDDR